MAATLPRLRVNDQGSAPSVEAYFSGKMVVLKIDMPGTQKGVDLKFNKPSPMDWKEYGSRVKQFGIAIHKGDSARVTSIVVKGDMIEFQLDGGGFGTFGDDTTRPFPQSPLIRASTRRILRNRSLIPTIRTRSRAFSVILTANEPAARNRTRRISVPHKWQAR